MAVDDRLNPAAYFASNNYTFTGVQDVDGATKYNVMGIPFTVFIDRNGNQVSSHVGAMDEAQLEAEIRKIL